MAKKWVARMVVELVDCLVSETEKLLVGPKDISTVDLRVAGLGGQLESMLA